MERSGPTAPAVRDYDDLAALLRRQSSFYVSVWASRPGATPDAISTRVQALRRTNQEMLPDPVLDELATSVESAFPEAAGVVSIADTTGVVFTEQLPEAPRAELVRVGSLPALSPVIEHRQASIPFVLVLADRRGGDLYWSSIEREGSTSVEGDDTFARKVQAGGWSHKRFQQRAENAWEHTAEEIVDELLRCVEAIGPRVITLGGDARVTEMIRKRLPETVAPIVRDVVGSRSADGSDEQREAEIRRWVRTAIAEDTVEVLRLFDQEFGQHDRAANGAQGTFAAMREARVDILLVHDDPQDERLAYYAPDEPAMIATERQTLTDVGAGEIREARMVDVAIRAAVLTGAGIRVVPAAKNLEGGIGAILRW